MRDVTSVFEEEANACRRRLYTKQEFARRGEGVYESKIRPFVEGANQGKFVVIAYEVDPADRLRAPVPLDNDREYGKQHKLQFAERFYYSDHRRRTKSRAEEYIEKNAVRI